MPKASVALDDTALRGESISLRIAALFPALNRATEVRILERELYLIGPTDTMPGYEPGDRGSIPRWGAVTTFGRSSGCDPEHEGSIPSGHPGLLAQLEEQSVEARCAQVRSLWRPRSREAGNGTGA